MSSRPLLSISIPTYNRVDFLNRCLSSILKQADVNPGDIEIIVCDNASTDTTSTMIEGHKSSQFSVTYFKQDANQGAERNVITCLLQAKGKYVWIFADDDLMVEGSLSKLIRLLEKDSFSNVHLKSRWFEKVEEIAQHPLSTIEYCAYQNPIDFFSETHYWMTFLTANIVQRELAIQIKNRFQFLGTNLVHLGWLLPVLFSQKKSLIVTSPIIACQSGNSGGYNIFDVFGKNLSMIFHQLASAGAVPKRAGRIINKALMRDFFVMFISDRNSQHSPKQAIIKLAPLYWSYRYFWFSFFPKLLKRSLVK